MRKDKIIKAIDEVVKKSTYDLLLPYGKISFMRNIKSKLTRLYNGKKD
jgi:DnaJ-domain-containing protein 1